MITHNSTKYIPHAELGCLPRPQDEATGRRARQTHSFLTCRLPQNHIEHHISMFCPCQWSQTINYYDFSVLVFHFILVMSDTKDKAVPLDALIQCSSACGDHVAGTSQQVTLVGRLCIGKPKGLSPATPNIQEPRYFSRQGSILCCISPLALHLRTHAPIGHALRPIAIDKVE